MAQSKHEKIESNVFLMIVLTLLTVSVGGLVEIVPLFFQHSTTTDRPQGQRARRQAVRRGALVGRDIYVREGCYNCHSQMIRPFRAETERYGHYSVAGEFVYDHPFQWGSKRTGPDLARVGGRYSDEWQRVHLLNPRDVVPESNMPAFPWLDRPVEAGDIQDKMRALQQGRPAQVQRRRDRRRAGRARRARPSSTRVVAYLQGLGTAISHFR
jgi:cytochrome c oxidase cbb3-type subunit 2